MQMMDPLLVFGHLDEFFQNNQSNSHWAWHANDCDCPRFFCFFLFQSLLKSFSFFYWLQRELGLENWSQHLVGFYNRPYMLKMGNPAWKANDGKGFWAKIEWQDGP